MSGFLRRWARLKARTARPAPAPVDPASLPSLETLTGESDVSAFLAAGVSQALQSQALRIAWERDARIASFRGFADYDWDFNAEGYGRLALADDVGAMLRQFTAPRENPIEQPAAAVRVSAAEPPSPEPEAPPETDQEPPRPTRRHGGALPA